MLSPVAVHATGHYIFGDISNFIFDSVESVIRIIAWRFFLPSFKNLVGRAIAVKARLTGGLYEKVFRQIECKFPSPGIVGIAGSKSVGGVNAGR